MFSLIDLLNQQPAAAGYLEKIGILDIGAMIIDGSKVEYSGLVDSGLARVAGFEPVKSECDRLNETHNSKGLYFYPYFIGDGTEQTFHLTNRTMTASLYEPNTPLLDSFINLGELTIPVSQEKVKTQRLDDIPEIFSPVDLLKMDIQGAELQALQGAREKVLKNILVIQAEVCWVKLYKNQPLFSEVELFLREQGFVLHRFTGFGTRPFKITSGQVVSGSGQQILWSDAIFIRDFNRLDLLNNSQLLKSAMIMHEAYGSIDLVCVYLEEFDKRTGSHIAPLYVQHLSMKTSHTPAPKEPEKQMTGDFVYLYTAGVEAFNKGDLNQALLCFNSARKQNSNFAPLFYNLGLVFGKLGQFPDAIAHLDEALRLDPGYKEAIDLRNGISGELSIRPVDQQAIKLPTFNSEKLARAIELQNANKLDEAEVIFKEILVENPQDVPCLFSLGGIEHNRRNPEKAYEYFSRALALRPDYAPIWYNIGIVHQSLKNFDKALEAYDQALKIDPTYREVLQNKGGLLAEMRRHKDALLNYEELLKHDPNNTKALCNRGILLSEVKFLDLAIHTFERLVALDPEYEFAQGLLCFAKMHACQWGDLEAVKNKVIEGVRTNKKICQTLPLTAISEEPSDHLACARVFSQHHCPSQKPMWDGRKYQHSKIRVGYVSPDLREHPVGHLTTALFENHDKNRFETFAFYLGADDQSNIHKRMRAAFDKFIDVRHLRSKDIAEMILAMEIDILIDLAGFTADSRTDIFAYRPAPLQVNYLGYSSTMGVDFIDYIIADKFIIPDEYRNCYSEKIVYMPDTYLPTDVSIQIAPTTPPREFYGLPAEGFIFCSFNHDYKITPAVFEVWMRLLKKVEGSVLWLMKLNESAEKNLLKEAENRGVDPGRIIFATRVANIEDHLARYRMADLFLDTTPCNAHSTASDVLRVGLPMVTCTRKAFAGRVAGSLLTLLGLPELVTHNIDEYEALALKLALNPDLLREYRTRLENNAPNSVIYNTAAYCSNLEKAYEKMWKKHLNGESPADFAV